MNEHFLLQTEMARRLYHEHAKKCPIIDYHCHLSTKMIAMDRMFDNLGQIWLESDHYKWRAMRANGIDEYFITGENSSDWEKFEKWAETVPYTMRNPLYHWTHLELQTAFNINELLCPKNAQEIYNHCTNLLKTKDYSTRNLMRRYQVEVVCTTDDPIDSLEYHLALQKEKFEIKVLPTWRPDKAMSVESPSDYRIYLAKLSASSGITINRFEDLLEALKKRHDFFASVGCKLSDHGLEVFYAEDYTLVCIKNIFEKIYRRGQFLTQDEISQFKSCMLIELAKMDKEKNWTQQFHYGTLRNNNSRMFNQIGADAGYDSIGDWNTAQSLSVFLNQLDKKNELARTILYNLNPCDNEVIATMIGNFQDSSIPCKMQFGAGWWFLDQKAGIEAQINSLSALGLLSHFVGMLTDSRSFLSYSRHEYFRRILCNLIGNDVEYGLLPACEYLFLAKLVKNISYYNAKKYFEF